MTGEGGLSQAASATIPQCRANPSLSLSRTQAAKFPRTYHIKRDERVQVSLNFGAPLSLSLLGRHPSVENHIPTNIRHSSLAFTIPECAPLLLFTRCHGTQFPSSSFCTSCLAVGVVIGHLLLVGNLRSQGGQTPAKQAGGGGLGGG